MKADLVHHYFGRVMPSHPMAGVARASRSLAAVATTQARCCGYFYTLREYVKIAALRNFSAHLAVSRALALPRVKSLSHYHPRSAFKYLRRYLAHNLCLHTRAAVLAHHYRSLNRHVTDSFMRRICEGQIALWTETRDASRYEIVLTYPRIGQAEGELALVFLEDSTPLFTLSFTIAPGRTFGAACSEVLFVGRLQGANGAFESIRRATKAFDDISPLAMLLAATQAIALSLDIPGIVGVGAQRQISVGGHASGQEAYSAYDGFWLAMDAEKIGANLFHLKAAPEQKPLSLIKSNHRSRVKRKRQFKSALSDSICATFRHSCLA